MSLSRTEKVLAAARLVFMRHGFQRVTMGDIAAGSGLSRPALYLIYPSKADIFIAVLTRVFAETLHDVREVLDRDVTVEHRLRAAFEIWCVRPFEMVVAAPDAKDLFESGLLFATDLVDAQFAAFEQLVAQQLMAVVRSQARVRLSAIQIARLMVAAAIGFKQSAKDAGQLRQMIAAQIAIVLASLR